MFDPPLAHPLSLAPRGGLRGVLASDVPASLVVFLVAMPLSMGIALASGAPILSGLIAAVVGGVVVGALAGAPLQVSGPAAGLAVIVFQLIQRFGFPAVCTMVVLAGAFQVLLGSLRVARLTLAISPAVIHGMLAGIGVLIALAQLHVVLGGAPESSAFQNLKELPGQIRDHHGPATLLGGLTILLLIVWPQLLRAGVRRWPALKSLQRLPPALVAVLIATVVSVLTHADVARVKLPTSLLGGLQWPAWPKASLEDIISAVLSLGLVASAESLLCAVATDKLHGGPRAQLDRELCAQGAGNVVSGLLGGLPITGVIVRSTANLEAGGKTRLSAMLHGVWVLASVTLLSGLITRIPLCVLAGLLVYVGTKLINLGHIRDLMKHNEALIYFVTLFGVVSTNLLTGIGLGIGVAVVQLLYRLTRTDISLEDNGTQATLRLRGSLTFVAVPRLSAVLAAVRPGCHLAVDLDVDFIDHATFEALHSFRSAHQKTGGTVDLDLRSGAQARSPVTPVPVVVPVMVPQRDPPAAQAV